LVDYITAFKAKVESYVQYAKDSQAFLAVITTTAKDPASFPVYARKFECSRNILDTQIRKITARTIATKQKQFYSSKNGNGDPDSNKEYPEENNWTYCDISNPNVDVIDGGFHTPNITQDMVANDGKEELLALGHH
jgi:hypothetical protein